MSRTRYVLFFTFVFVFGIRKGDGRTKESLEAEIKKTKEDVVTVDKECERIGKEILAESIKCLSLIKINTGISSNMSAENQSQQKKIEDLYKQLVKIYDEENQLDKVPLDIERLKLGIKVLNEDIEVLVKRRDNSMAKSCFDLRDMSNITVGKPGILSGSRSFDTIVLENKLRLVQSDLEDAERRKNELKMKLDSDRDLCDQKIQSLNNIIEKLEKNRRKGQETIDKISKELEEQKKIVAELTESAEASVKELEKWKKDMKKILQKYQQYALEVECYDKLFNDLKKLVSTQG